MKKILLIDDSALMRRIFCDIIDADHRYSIQDAAANGKVGLELLKKNKYDLILLDLVMPDMDGIAFLKEFNRLGYSTKVVILSAVAAEGAATTVEALSLGAVDFIKKPENIFGIKGDKFQNLLIKIIGDVLDEPEIKEIGKSTQDSVTKMKEIVQKNVQAVHEMTGHTVPVRREHRHTDLSRASKIVAIASSTGGPKALMEVIPYLPADLDAPVLIVQHMPAGFTESLAKRIDSVSPLHVVEAANGMVIEKGNVYLAPGGLHMTITHSGGVNKIALFDGSTREGVKPCANYMYEGLAETNYDHVTCAVLTGMGADGTEGISHLKMDKPVYVITQTKETCSVYGMPRNVDNAGLSDESRPLTKVAEAIIKNVGVRKDGR